MNDATLFAERSSMKREPLILLRAFALGALLLFLALVPAPAHAAGGPHRVGVIYYGGEWENLLDGLRQGLRELGVEEEAHRPRCSRCER